MTTQSQAKPPNRKSPDIKPSPSSGEATHVQDTEMFDAHPALTPESLDDNRSETAPAASDIPIRSTPQPETTTNESLSVLGHRCKLLLSAINELQAFGVDSTIPLPKIVVVGDQSAGKSSLIEAISEIKVPRDAGCCTRCPLQLNLRNDESENSRWTCSISLIKKFTYSPDTDPSDNALYPWIENAMPSATQFGTVYSRDELEAAIRRAQVATLNPQMPPHRYMAADCDDSSLLVQFSPNVVALDISAPNIPNLSFYDLPGVISQSRDGRKDTINLVRELVRHYVGQENSLILLAIPFESDIDNSKASAILSEENANDRTIGVLTKPDRLQSDDRVDNWVEVLRGEAFAKGHGYFVVKQPSQQDLKKGMTHAEARTLEEAFFESKFWTRRFHGFQDRQGTYKLQKTLSQKLASLILECLPNITEKVLRRLAEINEELNTLPDPPANALHCVNKAIADFGHHLRANIDGENGPNELLRLWKKARRTFLEDVTIHQRPVLLVNESLYNTDNSSPNSPAPAPNPNQKKVSKPSKRGREVTILLDSSDEDMALTPKRFKTVDSPFRRGLQPWAEPLKTRFRLDDIQKLLDEHSASGLPGSIEPKAVDRLILSALENWHIPLQKLTMSLRDAIGHLLKDVLDKSVSEWRTTPLWKEMLHIIGTFIELHVGDLESHVAARALRMERTKPITNDVETLIRCEREERQVFRAARFRERSEVYFNKQEEITGKHISCEDRERKRITKDAADEIEKRIGTDPFAREVDVMAKIRGYYKIASTRFVDNICQAVEADLFLRLRNGLQDDLVDALHLTQSDCHEWANRLLDDDPVRARRRDMLKKQKLGLEQAVQRIKQLNREIDC